MARSLVYCKEKLEFDPDTNAIVNDPIRTFISVADLI